MLDFKGKPEWLVWGAGTLSTFCNEGCEAEWELLKFSRVHPYTRKQIELFYSSKSKQLGLGLQNLYGGYSRVLGKDWEFKDWLFRYPALEAYPHVARAIVQANSKDSENLASEPKAITVDENEQGRARRNDASYRVAHELKYHNGVIREYANKRWAQVEEALMRLEGLTYAEAYDNYLESQIFSLEGGPKGSWLGRALKNVQRSLGTAVEQSAPNLPLPSSNERIASGQKQLSEGAAQPQREKVERVPAPQTSHSGLPLKLSNFFNTSFYLFEIRELDLF